jgi:hypothetical protein
MDNTMDIIQITAFLLILGTVIMAIGFGTFPSIIYTGRDVQFKLDLLKAQPRRWVLSQLIVILGTLVSMAGSIFLILLFRESLGFIPAVISAVGFNVGHALWAWIVGMRITEPPRQAQDDFPGWMFRTFSILTLLGLSGFGIAFWLQGIHLVLGIGIILGSLSILGLFLKFKGMPPIIYFTITLVMGVALLL